jgi:hypothetical protein
VIFHAIMVGIVHEIYCQLDIAFGCLKVFLLPNDGYAEGEMMINHEKTNMVNR